MNKKGDTTAWIIGIIVSVILVVTIVPPIINSATSLSSNYETGFELANNTASALDNSKVSTVSVQGKGGQTLGVGNYTLNSDAGTITLCPRAVCNKYNTSLTNPNANVSYHYEGSAYIESGTNRTIVATITILMAAALLCLIGMGIGVV